MSCSTGNGNQKLLKLLSAVRQTETMAARSRGAHKCLVVVALSTFIAMCRKGRKQAMEAFGAEVVRITGNYDESVRLADSEARNENRVIVSDTSYEGYMEIPKDVALGYTVMLAEIVEQLDGEIPLMFCARRCGWFGIRCLWLLLGSVGR